MKTMNIPKNETGYSLYSNQPIEIKLNDLCLTCENYDCPKRKIIEYIFEDIDE